MIELNAMEDMSNSYKDYSDYCTNLLYDKGNKIYNLCI